MALGKGHNPGSQNLVCLARHYSRGQWTTVEKKLARSLCIGMNRRFPFRLVIFFQDLSILCVFDKHLRCSTRDPGSWFNADLSRPLCLCMGKLKRWSGSDMIMIIYCVLCRTSCQTTWIRIWYSDPADPVSVPRVVRPYLRFHKFGLILYLYVTILSSAN